jgi:hypothetical protein
MVLSTWIFFANPRGDAVVIFDRVPILTTMPYTTTQQPSSEDERRPGSQNLEQYIDRS